MFSLLYDRIFLLFQQYDQCKTIREAFGLYACSWCLISLGLILGRILGELDTLVHAIQVNGSHSIVCAGLIVGRSFDKFHNLDVNKHTPDDNFVLYEKLDGSLIILFYYENEWIVASRGSFIGPQVTRAQKFLIQKYDISKLEKDKSHVFELLYPENKIVVDYGDREEMVYLASFRKDGAESFDTEIMEKAGFAVVRTIKDIHGYDGHYDAFKALNLLNSEGAVVRFGNGSRAKIKFENYVQSHHKRADLNVFGVWKAFKEEKLVEDLAKEIPDESYDWLNRTWTNFENRVAEMRMKVQEKLDGLGDVKHSRALFARTIKDDPDKALLFALYYDKPTAFHKAACDKCKPEA